MTTSVAVVYDNFAGGEFGLLGAHQAGKRIGMFTAMNMRRYRTGAIGPRPGMKALTITGLAASGCWGVCYAPFAGAELLIFVGNNVYLAPLASGAAAATLVGNLAIVPSKIIQIAESTRRVTNQTLFTVYNDKSYVMDHTFGTCTALASSPGGRTMELYGDRLAVAGTPAGARLYFSDPASFGSWPAGNYIDIGYDYAGYWLVTQRGGLTQFGQALIHRITGSLGSSQTVRQASSALAAQENGVVLDGDTGLYVPQARSAPVLFDGGLADEDRFAHLEWQTSPGAVGCAIARKYRDVLFVSGVGDNRALLRSNGAWTYHTFGVNVLPAVTRVLADRFIIADTGGPPTFYSLDMSIDRPGFTTDNWTSPGDNSTVPFDAWLQLPEHWDDQGREIRVRSVIIDITKWSTGSASSNHFDLTVRALNRYQASGPQDSATQSFDEAGAAASAGGTDERIVLGFGDQGSGGGFQLRFGAIRGVAIRGITVVADEVAARAA